MAEPQRPEFKATADYNTIKETISNTLAATSQWYYLCAKDWFKGYDIARFEAEFKASVLQLYVLISPKTTYVEGFKDLEQLREIVHAYPTKKNQLSIKDAIKYFMRLRLFLEKIGITQIEIEQTERGTGLVSAWAEGKIEDEA